MTTQARNWLTPMRPRAADEPHRVATPLELFFDLCFVVAVAQAALPLHHFGGCPNSGVRADILYGKLKNLL